MARAVLKNNLNIIDINTKAVIDECSLELISKNPYVLKYSTSDGKHQEFSAENAFEALSLLRKKLESQGQLIQCNGSRVDAYPSNMCLQMGGGLVLYIIQHGVKAKKSDMVPSLAEAPVETIGTIQQQRQNQQEWLKS